MCVPMSPSTKVGPEVFGLVRHFTASGRALVVAGVEAMGVLQVDHADVAEHPLLHHRRHLVDQRMAGEAVGDADDQALRLGERGDLLALGHGEEERLLADHVDAGLEQGLGDLVVREVRRRDGDDLDAVVALRLLGDQRLVVRIEPLLGDAEVAAEVAAPLGVDVEGAADHPVGGVVAQRAGAVLVADLAGAAAADHAPAQRAVDELLSVVHLRQSFLASVLRRAADREFAFGGRRCGRLFLRVLVDVALHLGAHERAGVVRLVLPGEDAGGHDPVEADLGERAEEVVPRHLALADVRCWCTRACVPGGFRM